MCVFQKQGTNKRKIQSSSSCEFRTEKNMMISSLAFLFSISAIFKQDFPEAFIASLFEDSSSKYLKLRQQRGRKRERKLTLDSSVSEALIILRDSSKALKRSR